VAKGGAAGDVSRNGWGIHVAQAVFFVADVAFLLEDAELSADGGIAGLARDFCQDLADGSTLESIENVHDLAFAAGQGVWLGFSRHVLFFQQLC
jgi:hypothetical protein